MFACKRCRRQVVVCSSCERGQHYCSKVCSKTSRAENCRASGGRYRQTERGRKSGRTRQRRYRQNDADRRREEARRAASEAVDDAPDATVSADCGSADTDVSESFDTPDEDSVTHHGSAPRHAPLTDMAVRRSRHESLLRCFKCGRRCRFLVPQAC